MIVRSAQRCLISGLLCFAAFPAASQTIEVTVEPPGVQTSSVTGVVTETFDSTSTAEIRASGYSLPSGIGTVAANNLTINSANAQGGAGGIGQYAFTNSSALDITLSEPRRYLGFWWSTGAGNDSVAIYGSVNGAGPETLLGTYSVANISSLLTPTANCPGNIPNGHFGNPNSAYQCSETPFVFAYVNLNLSDPSYFFTRVVFDGDFLEFDNVSVSGAFVGTSTTVPDAPTIGTAIIGEGQANVSFTPPINDGGATITNYTVTSAPGGLTGACSSSPCTVTGLSNGTPYTFTVVATNSEGDSAASAASNSVTFTPSGQATPVPVLPLGMFALLGLITGGVGMVSLRRS